MNYIEELSKYMSESKLFPLWEKYKDDVCVAPAAVTFHHNFEGGLVRHIVEMIKFGLPIALGIKEGVDSADGVTEGKISFDDFLQGQATLIDPNEFINVCFLHDLAKLEFYKKDGDGSIYTYVKHEFVVQEMVVQNMCASLGISLTESEINALWLAEGGYSPLFKELKATPLATLVHMADLFSSQLLQPKKVINAACPSCATGTLVRRTGTAGPFWGCSAYPNCKYTTQEMPEMVLLERSYDGF